MIQVAMVFLGGGLGSLFRYGITRLMANYSTNFPYATLTANALSCIVLGFGAYLVQDNAAWLTPSVRLFLLVGFCGGFSTYSTFTNETYQLIQSEDWTLAAINIFGNLLVCLIGLVIGIQLGKLI